ncbi:MAG: hypothetical protein V3U75_11780, partial [Methylococcaceae bacterium]
LVRAGHDNSISSAYTHLGNLQLATGEPVGVINQQDCPRLSQVIRQQFSSFPGGQLFERLLRVALIPPAVFVKIVVA